MWRHMDRNDFDVAIAMVPDGYQSQTSPLLDLKSGYIKRAERLLPKQGRVRLGGSTRTYLRDSWLMRRGPITNDGITYLPRRVPAQTSVSVQVGTG